jgi:RNA polymerase sigma factor (sigma-70 family)
MLQFSIGSTWLPAWPSYWSAVTMLAASAKPLVYDKIPTGEPEMKITKEIEAAFLLALEEHHWIIDRICRAYGDTRADREDLYQEIIANLWEFYPTFTGGSKISTWMYTVALRSAIQPFRRTSRLRIELMETLPDRPSEERLPDDGPDDRIFLLIQETGNYERAILMLLIEGYSTREIGVMLEMTQEAVATRIRRIRKDTKTKI